MAAPLVQLVAQVIHDGNFAGGTPLLNDRRVPYFFGPSTVLIGFFPRFIQRFECRYVDVVICHKTPLSD